MADATGTGAVYHVQAIDGPAAVVSYQTFRNLLAKEVSDVDDVLQALVPDVNFVHGALFTLWVTSANPTFVPPARTAGAPAGVSTVAPVIVTTGGMPVSTTVVKGKRNRS